MGRRSIERSRKPLTEKAKGWIRDLIPKLQDKDLSKLTLDDLASLMGKSKSTIYSYFSTKEEIYITAVQLVLNDMASLGSFDLDEDDMEGALRLVLTQISAGIEDISISFLEQIRSAFPQAWAIIEEFAKMVLNLLENIYKEGMKQGAFKEYNISLLSSLDNYFVMNMMTNASLFSKQGMTLDDLVKEYLELRLSALRP